MSAHISAPNSLRSTTEAPLTLQAGWVLIAKIVAFVSTVALPIVVVRRLSQGEFGVYKQAFLVVSTALMLLPMGVGMSAFYFLPRQSDRRGQVVFNILLFHLAGGLVVAFAFALWPTLLGTLFNSPQMTSYAPAIGLVILFWSSSSILEAVAIANQEVKLAMAIVIALNCTKSIFLIGAVFISATVQALILGAMAQGILQTLLLFVYLRSRFGKFWTSFDWAFMRGQLAYASPFGVAGLLYSMQSDLHKYFVSRQFGPGAYAIYAVGCFQLPIIDLLSESVSSVTIPRVSRLQKLQRQNEIIELIARMVRKLAAVYLPLYIFLLVMGRELLTVLFTEQYVTAWPIFAINLTAIPLTMITNAYDPVLRAYAEHRYFLLRVRAALLPMLVGGLWWAIQRFGLVGAISVVIGIGALEQTIVALKVTRILNVSRHDLVRLKDISKLAAAACVAGGFTFAARVFFQGFDPWMMLVICAIIFALAYLSAILLSGVAEQSERAGVREHMTLVRRYIVKTVWATPLE